MELEKFGKEKNVLELEKLIDKEIGIFYEVYNRCKERGIDNRDAVVAIYREVATDIRGEKIRENREARRFVTVRVRDGKVKTVEVKEDLKRMGFKFDSEKRLWYKKLLKRNWDEISRNEIFSKLEVEVVE